MKTKTLFLCAALTLSAAAAFSLRAESGGKGAAAKTPEFINAGDLKWGDVPPALPKGAQIAVLHGDPFKSGPFTVRLKMPANYKIPPHWHTQDEQLTILSGTFVLHMGDTMEAGAHDLTAGAYHFLPGKMHHAAEAKGEVVLQLHGNGPFDIHYLNAADDPSKKAAK
jgi:mannose-6-phosphate isomerase-like protein (cupin superfamily)